MKWLDNPITWRKYLKVAGIASIIGILIAGVELCVFYWDDISYKIDVLKNSIERKFGKE